MQVRVLPGEFLKIIAKYFVYILKSLQHDKYYIGSSQDPHRRLQFHNSIERGFTSRYKPWKIVWLKAFPDKSQALKAEKKIKRWKSRGGEILNGRLSIEILKGSLTSEFEPVAVISEWTWTPEDYVGCQYPYFVINRIPWKLKTTVE